MFNYYDIQNVRTIKADDVDSYYFVIPNNTIYSMAVVLAGALAPGEGYFTANVATGDDPATAEYFVESNIASIVIRNTNVNALDELFYGGAKRQQYTIFPTGVLEVPMTNLQRNFLRNPVTSSGDITVEVILFKKDR
ncbi:MAG: hypothetical protein ABII90_03615 [Bacteroidota bacterium]